MSELETFESGATRYSTGRRYDLMSPFATTVIDGISDYTSMIIDCLLNWHCNKRDIGECTVLYRLVADCVDKSDAEILDLYAQALDEGAKKYGARNWEKGMPESNLVNHAIAHAIKLDAGDTSEDHASHLIWNILTIIHFSIERRHRTMFEE